MRNLLNDPLYIKRLQFVAFLLQFLSKPRSKCLSVEEALAAVVCVVAAVVAVAASAVIAEAVVVLAVASVVVVCPKPGWYFVDARY